MVWSYSLLALGTALVCACSLEGRRLGGGGDGGAPAGGSGNQPGRGGSMGVDPGSDCAVADEGKGFCRDGLLEVCRRGRLVFEADCGREAQCSALRGECLDCAPGAFRCSGAALEQCNLEGSGFEVVRTCDTEAACVSSGARGYCAICPVETRMCEAYALEFATSAVKPGSAARPQASLRACRADGSGTQPLALCDAGAALCDAPELRCQACEPGAMLCVGAELRRCDADGSELDLVAHCGHPARCDADRGECLPDGCTDDTGARRAVGSVACINLTQLSICGASGLWEFLDLCDNAAACDAGVAPRRCLDDDAGFCVPGASRCVANAVQRCAEFEGDGSPEVTGGHWYVYAHCTNRCVTSAAGIADCDDPALGPPYTDVSACEPGSTTFLNCASGSCIAGECPSGQVCAGSASGCQVCAPDKVRCDGNVLKVCNMTGTTENVLEDCGAGVCDGFRGRCLPVKPGERLCVGGELQRVSVDGAVQSIASCGAQALCDPAGGCRPPVCVVGSVACDGAVVLECRDGLERTATGARCESAERCESGLGCARARRLAAGDAHTCRLIVAEGAAFDDAAAGYVQCWGANESGQLGNGSSLFGDEPEARHVVVESADGELTAAPVFRASGLCAGRDFSCADVVLPGGGSGVACWGANDRGQLGIAGAAAGAPSRSNAVVAFVSAGVDASPRDGAPDPLVDLSRVSCGAEHACALDGAGRAWCWGANGGGQLAAPTSRAFSAAATRVEAPRPWVSLFAGGRHTCGVDSDQGLWCWGDGGVGQLGQVNPRGATPPTLLRGLIASRAALGADFSLVQAAEAEAIVAFGGNFFGQLSTGTALPSVVPIATRGLPSERVSALHAGPTAAHACAVVDGSLACWGANPLGQLGDGSQTDRYEPVIAVDGRSTPLLETPGSVALGRRHSCAIDASGGVLCWGTNQRGELGAGAEGGASHLPLRVY